MNARYFLFAAACLPFMIQSERAIGQSHTFIINNGQIDLIANGIELPANPDGKTIHQVPVSNLNLIITVPGDAKVLQKIKLLPADLGNTIKVGGYYNNKEQRYIVSVLRSNQVPLLFALKNAARRLSLPRQL